MLVSPNVVQAADADLQNKLLAVLNECLFIDAVIARNTLGDPMEQQFLHLHTRASLYGDGFSMEILLCNPHTSRVYYRAAGGSIEETVEKFKQVLINKETVN